MAKHKVKRRKPNVMPITNTKPSSFKPKKAPTAHRKSYYKPKTPKIATTATKSITPLNMTSQIREVSKLKKREQKLHKRQYKATKKKARKLYRELRRQEKLENKTRTKIRTKAKYKIEQDKPQATEYDIDGELTVSWQTQERTPDMRTVKTLDRPPQTSSDNLFEMVAYLDSAISNLELSPQQGGWNKAGTKKLSLAMEKMQDLLALEKKDPAKFDAIVASLNASKDMSRVKDIVYLQIYEDVATEADELLDVIEGILKQML